MTRQQGDFPRRLGFGAMEAVDFLAGSCQDDGLGPKSAEGSTDPAFADTLRRHLRPDIPVQEIPANINDPEFARTCAEPLLAPMAITTPIK